MISYILHVALYRWYSQQNFRANLFRKLHPGHSVVMSVDYGLNVLSYPGAVSIPIKPDEVIANTLFIPLSRHVNGIPGVLADSVEFGCFRTAWDVSRIIYLEFQAHS